VSELPFNHIEATASNVRKILYVICQRNGPYHFDHDIYAMGKGEVDLLRQIEVKRVFFVTPKKWNVFSEACLGIWRNQTIMKILSVLNNSREVFDVFKIDTKPFFQCQIYYRTCQVGQTLLCLASIPRFIKVVIFSKPQAMEYWISG
jgi:hypothetical protein